HVGDKHGMSWESALDEDVPDLNGLERHLFQLPLQRVAAGIDEHALEVAAERGVAVVGLGLSRPPLAVRGRPLAPRPAGPGDAAATRVVEPDLAGAALGAQPLGPEPHDGVRALLQVLAADVDVND